MDLLDLYFSSNRYFVTKHHIDSYNEFVNATVQKVIKSMNPFKVIKNDANGNLRYEILIHIGGPDSDQLFYSKCTTGAAGEERLMYPNECRMKNKSYVSNLFATVVVDYIEGDRKITREFENVFLCKIPIMLQSNLCMLNNQPQRILQAAGECVYDQGGYFVIDGKEKVIVAQERNVTNRLYVNKIEAAPAGQEKAEDNSVEAFIRCTSEKNSVFPKTFWLYINRKKGTVHARVPHIALDVPIFTLFRALGVEGDKDVVEMICGGLGALVDFLRPSILAARGAATQKEALVWLSEGVEYKYSVENVMYVLFEDFLPNVPDALYHKAVVLGLLVRQLCEVALGLREESDRDNYMQKRVGISGYLLGDVFKDFYNKFRVATRNKVDNTYEVGSNHNTLEELSMLISPFEVAKFFGRSKDFQTGLIKSLKGNWGLSGDPAQQGIVQDLNRVSYVGFLSHLRRVSAPMSDVAVKIRRPHQLGTSQWGYMCPCESPDGISIGLIKNMAVLNHVTAGSDPQDVLDALAEGGFEVSERRIGGLGQGQVRLHVNNNWIGMVERPAELVRYVRLLRQNGYIDPMVSVSWTVIDHMINILTDSGRCTRPLILLPADFEAVSKAATWADLCPVRKPRPAPRDLERGAALIDFVDVEESNTCLIAIDRAHIEAFRHTHCEIHPSTMFSVYTATIPLPNHNAAPRNVFSGAQGKQAVGVYATNFNRRIDTTGLILHYPQRALVSTRYMEYLNVNKLPNGENLIVAIMTYTGYNQEDSIIVNRDSVARGMFNMTYFTTHVAAEWKKNEAECVFAKPDPGLPDLAFADYDKIDERGFPRVGARIEPGDCIVGKVIRTVDETVVGDVKTDIFVERLVREHVRTGCDIADKTTYGVVNKVAVFELDQDPPCRGCKVQLRQTREPELGDKMASRHGQKGVIGAMLPAHQMPFTREGLVPDIIVNPHAFPSRMTIGHLIECIMAKAAALDGFYADGTAFENQDPGAMAGDVLEAHGYNRHGDEIMYNGITGEQMPCDIFIGPTYYLRLKHMVADKINYRARGKMVGLTHQPPKGRGNDGGLRIGEMETNAIIAHGIGGFAKESMMERSDGFQVGVQDLVGAPSQKKINIPYSMKLLSQELMGLSIDPRFCFDSDGEGEFAQGEGEEDGEFAQGEGEEFESGGESD